MNNFGEWLSDNVWLVFLLVVFLKQYSLLVFLLVFLNCIYHKKKDKPETKCGTSAKRED